MLAVLLAACSFTDVKRRPAIVEPTTRLTCTDSYWFPLADVAMALGITAIAVFTDGFIESECEEGDSGACATGTRVIAGAVYSSPFTISAIYGAVNITGCRSAAVADRGSAAAPRRPDRPDMHPHL